MSDHVNRRRPDRGGPVWSRRALRSQADGQALIEYVLIIVLVTIALIAVLAITGPAVGNIFSNAVYNLLGATTTPRNTMQADDFWTQVAAVASYTPDNPSLVTNTPAAGNYTQTAGPSPTTAPPQPTNPPASTATPGAAPTPSDQNFGYPFNDGGTNPDWWDHDFGGLLNVTWNAEFWNYTGFLNDMSSMAAGTGKYRTTVNALDFTWPSGTAPGTGVAENFYARYTTTTSLENKRYTWHIKKDNGVRIWVNDVLVVDQNKPNAGDLLTWTDNWNTDPIKNNWFDRSFTPAAGQATIRVEYFDGGGSGELHVFLIDSGLLDQGECDWQLSNEAFHSPPTAWSDSPGKPYAAPSTCILALRGYIDLRGSLNPKLEFWDRYDLGANTTVRVGIAVAGTGNWTDYDLHRNETNLGWSRQTFDLRNFADPDGPGAAQGRDFSNDLIELRFVLQSTGTVSKQGWWIDDIKVDEEQVRRYTVGFSDDMEGVSHWYPGGSWARTNEQIHSGSASWSDSPGGNYVDGSNNILELDGLIDLKNPIVTDPEMVFWHRYDLTYNDSIYAEISLDNRYTWTALKGAPLAYRTTNLSWSQLVIPLSAYKGREFYFRFRLDSRSDPATADGWYIDDFSLRNRPDSLIALDWCDNIESGGAEWIPSGSWAVVNGLDVNPDQSNQTVNAHGGSQFWSDSPHANYAHNTNSTLQLKSVLDLNGTSDPEMVFWHQWDVANSDDLYVEVSTNDGDTWQQLWTYQYNNAPAGYGSFPSGQTFNHVLSWTREAVSLRSFIGQTLRLRFRLDALYNSSVDDGWWLDDICFQEHNEPVRNVPFTDGFEGGPSNWYTGGTWSIASENKHSGAQAFTDSYGVPYKHETNSILELRGAIDLSGTVKPTLYYWEAFSLGYDDYGLVEMNVSGDGGKTWGGWNTVYTHRYETTTSWDRRQIGQADMSAYIGKLVRVRFRLYSEIDSRVSEGWWIDDVSVVDRNGKEPVFTLPFNENAESTNNYWVMDGTWTRTPLFRTIGSGTALGPGGWSAQYFLDSNRNAAFDTGEARNTITEPDLDIDWGTTGPNSATTGLPAGTNQYFLVRFTRTIMVSNNNTEYQIQAQSDDGIRIFVDGKSVIPNAWVGRNFPATPDSVNVTLNEGPHQIIVEYFQGTGSARILVNFGITGRVFTDSPSGNYFHQNDMAMTLEGVIDLTTPGLINPALTYWEKRDLGAGDSTNTEISTDEGFTWTLLDQKTGTDTTWSKELIDLTSYIGKRINIRFRLDARSDTRTGDGWYIDDIQVAD